MLKRSKSKETSGAGGIVVGSQTQRINPSAIVNDTAGEDVNKAQLIGI
jgi:hypothetical protein